MSSAKYKSLITRLHKKNLITTDVRDFLYTKNNLNVSYEHKYLDIKFTNVLGFHCEINIGPDSTLHIRIYDYIYPSISLGSNCMADSENLEKCFNLVYKSNKLFDDYLINYSLNGPHTFTITLDN